VVGVPTVGVTVTFNVLEEEFPQGFTAITVIVAVPEKPAAQVTVALFVVPEIVFPEPLTLHV
jgi:hypothetical protein